MSSSGLLWQHCDCQYVRLLLLYCSSIFNIDLYLMIQNGYSNPIYFPTLHSEAGGINWSIPPFFEDTSQEFQTSFPLTFFWLELSHTVVPGCKGSRKYLPSYSRSHVRKNMRKDIVGHLEVSVILPKYSNTIVKPSHIIFNGLEHIRQYISVFISKELPPEFSALTLHWPDWDFPPKLLPYV